MELRPNGRRCELCCLPAAVHCLADEASLCWDCDAHVHAANFLVARHWRMLFCSSCGALTELGKTGRRIETNTPCCHSCAVGEVCTGGSELVEATKVVASPSRDNSVVSSCESESGRTRRRFILKRPRVEAKQARSARRKGSSMGSRRIETKLALQVVTGDETSCESNVLQQSTSTAAANADRRNSVDLVGYSEEASVCVNSASTSPCNGSSCEDRWHRR